MWISAITTESEWTGKIKRLSVQKENKIDADLNTVCFSLCYPVYNDYTYKVRNVDKIIRPAYKPLAPYREYIKLDDR